VITEKQTQNQRLDLLIRQGMMPARQLPILHRALANMKMGKILTPYERDAMQQLLDKMMGFQFGDDVTFNRARLHTQKTKYQTEENEMVSEEDVIIYDGSKDEQEALKDKKAKKKVTKDTNGPGQSNAEEEDMKEEHARGANRPADKHEGDTESPKQGSSVVPPITDGPKQSGKPGAEEPSSHSKTAKVSEGAPSIGEGLISDLDAEGLRARQSRRFKRAGKKSKDALMKGYSKSLRKQKMKESTITKDIKAFNDAYKEHLNKSLEDHGVDNIRDIPQEAKKEFFDDLDETITKKHLKQAKGIAYDKRYVQGNYTGAAKAMEKVKKGLSSHPDAMKHLKHANEETEVAEATAAEVIAKRMKSTHPDDNPQTHVKTGKNEYKMNPNAKARSDKASFSTKGKTAMIKKQVKRRPAQYGVTEGADPEVEVEKTPNEKVKALHNTVRDMQRGEGEFETLVVDPNVELQKETDRLYNDVQEGAKADAMRDIKADSGRGMAPLKTDAKPGKKSKHDGSANKGPEHIVAQMRKAVSLGDKHDGVKFKDGKTHKVSSAHAHKFLNKYMEGKPADKVKMQDHAHASHDNFKKHVE